MYSEFSRRVLMMASKCQFFKIIISLLVMSHIVQAGNMHRKNCSKQSQTKLWIRTEFISHS